jgi:hypothetical protein
MRSPITVSLLAGLRKSKQNNELDGQEHAGVLIQLKPSGSFQFCILFAFSASGVIAVPARRP